MEEAGVEFIEKGDLMNPFIQELKRLRQFRKRNHRCHELASILIMETKRDDLLFVQGKLQDIINIEHSWIEHAPTGVVLDPVKAEIFDMHEYRGKAIKKYTKQEACREIIKEGNYCYFTTTLQESK
jgi:hypothetical protein